MGYRFLVLHSGFAVPGLLLRVLVLLSYVQRLFFWVLRAVGLGDLLDPDNAIYPEGHGHGQAQQRDHRHPYQPHQFRSAAPAAALIQEVLPALRYGELMAEEHGRRVGGSCAVCLREIEVAEEVRRLSNCRHVFHRACLDQWLEHDQRACPLCRATLVPDEAAQDGAFGGRETWEHADAMPDAYYVHDFSYSSSYPPSPSFESPRSRCRPRKAQILL